MAGKINFDDLRPQRQEFSVGGRDYVLCEMTEGESVAFQQQLARLGKAGPDGKLTDVHAVVDSNSRMLSHCVRAADSGQAVTIEVIQSWPAFVVDRLTELAKAMNKAPGEEEAKNS
jgi:hypothetical protein